MATRRFSAPRGSDATSSAAYSQIAEALDSFTEQPRYPLETGPRVRVSAGEFRRLSPRSGGMEVVVEAADARTLAETITLLIEGALGAVRVRPSSGKIDGGTALTYSAGADRLVILRSNGGGRWATVGYADGAVVTAMLADLSVTTAKLAADAVTNTKLANMAQATIKLRASGAGTGDPTDGTISQALEMMTNGSSVGAVPVRSSSNVWRGLLPGTSGEYLRTQGSSDSPVWGNAGLLRVSVITTGTAATFTHVTGARICRVVGAGSGGAGGGTDAAAGSIGGNGGSGTYGEWTFTIAAATSTYTAGAAGTGVSGAAGNNGASSTWTHNAVTLTLPGGSGGAHVAGGTTIVRALGGAGGGAATGEDFEVLGQRGGSACRMGAIATAIHMHNGPAGSTPLGNGGPAAMSLNSGAFQGTAGSGIGAGGSGQLNGTSTAAAAGANGAPGGFIVWEYS